MAMGCVGPAMPALLMSTSRRRRWPTRAASWATDSRVANVAGDGGGVGQARGKALERALAAGGEDEMISAFGERLGDGETEAARGSGDEGELGRAGMGRE